MTRIPEGDRNVGFRLVVWKVKSARVACPSADLDYQDRQAAIWC